jgi:asparagine synthase (glutamine-hydrolysing)
MCGIGGILRITPAPSGAPDAPGVASPDTEWTDEIDRSISHRGPDGQGRFSDKTRAADGSTLELVLIHRRMAIIDLAGGDQPMVSALTGSEPAAGSVLASAPGAGPTSNGLAVVFNGCIYNHRPLRTELESLGRQFRTDHSDTEVLLHGWRAWGPELFGRLEGMFALAIWDRDAASLVLARDRFGEKPLYWTEGLDKTGAFVFAFASTPMALRGRSSLPSPAAQVREKARTRMIPWLRFGWGPRPPFDDVEALGPGDVRGFGVEAARRFGLTHYQPLPLHAWWKKWAPPFPRRTAWLSANDVERELSRAVRERLEADVPLGCFLSGGVDSSLILKFAHDADPGIHAFTVRMPDPGIDESKHAAAVAQALGARHEILDCQARPAEDLVRLIGQLGLPFGDSSLLPTYWVSRAAAQRVKAALSGDGGDELFAGYERYRAARLFAMLGPMRPLLGLFQHAGDADPKSGRTRRARFLQAAAGGGFADLLSVFPGPMLRKLAPSLGELSDRRGWAGSVRELGGEISGRAATAHAILCDVLGYLPDDILRKTDTASMAVPIEVRAPFLDSKLAELALSARISSLTPGGERKGLLRQVARRHLPAAVVDRPKQGFAIPIGEWFRTDFGGLKTLLLDTLHAADPFPAAVLGCELDMEYVRRLEHEHAERIADHGQRLYLLLVLSLWARTIQPTGLERR